MNDLKAKFLRFMQGRYGEDSLNKFLFKLLIACFILNLLGLRFFSPISTAVTVIYIFRFFSKNYNRRYAENQTYLKLTEGLRWKFSLIKKNIEYRKTHKILKCKNCKKKLSVPKGKGKIEVSCPCGNKIIIKS